MGKHEPQMIIVDNSRLDRLEAHMAAIAKLLMNSQIKPKEEWLTISEAVEEYGLCASTIYRKARAGEIEVKGTGKARRYRF